MRFKEIEGLRPLTEFEGLVIGGLFNCNGKTDEIHKNVLQVK